MKDQQNNDKLMKENEKLKEEMAKKDQQIGIMKEEITKLQEENQGLKEQMAKIKNSGKRQQKSSICRRPLPAELMNELFTSLSLENALGLLTKMPNGLLARNVQKMLNDIKTKMKSNKWNMADCGPKLAISDDGFVVEHSGSNVLNCVRAIWPIPTFNFCATTKKPLIIFYYEVEILMKQWIYGITIGFNTRQFPLEGNWRGKAKNSFGFNCKRIMWWFDESNKFENATRGYFAKGDIIGIGIIHSWANSSMQMQYFSTCNGELLGKVELPAKFAKIKLFPAVTLFNTGESIRANFGKEKFCFKDFDKLLQ